jgi:alpha/beta superfamily hydrolase
MDKAPTMDTAMLKAPFLKTPHPENSIKMAGPAGIIEVRMSLPVTASPHQAVAVICHPHPLHGGSLDNKVTATLARTMNAMGVPALRFNFRGVGASAGDFASGVGETEDLLAVIRQTHALYPDRALWLAGFSFGAYVALRASQRIAVERLITVAPPVNLYDLSELTAPDCPWLLLQGKDDEVVPFKDVSKWVSRLYPAPDTVYLDDVGHYFHGKLSTLQTLITNWLTSQTTPHRFTAFP